MKKNYIILSVFLFLILECQQKNKDNNNFITVDVTKTDYPKKELILQDFMDVEYVELETNDDFVNQGLIQDIGKNLILVRNRTDDGNIFVYDRNGKALRIINHKGQGEGEYISITVVKLDEENNEIFVNDHFRGRILVYDLSGNYKRNLKIKKDTRSLFYNDFFIYDKNNLICYEKYNNENSFVLVSKRDGSIKREIEIPFKKKKFLEQIKVDEANNVVMVSPGYYRTIIPHKNIWILSELSSDTVYTLLPNYDLIPFLARIPSIQSMEPAVFLILRLLSERYYFLETIKNKYDFDNERGFPKTFMMYDINEKTMFNYIIYNGDFLTKKEIYMGITRPINHEIESWYPYEAYQLRESFSKGELKGKLKEIAAKLDEESNPVIMLIKHKK